MVTSITLIIFIIFKKNADVDILMSLNFSKVVHC